LKPPPPTSDSRSLLIEREAMLRAVLDTAVDAIITIDSSGKVESFNRAAERIFGRSAQDVIGRNVKMLMPSPYREEHDQYLERFLKTGERKIIGIGREIVAMRADGTLFPIDLSVSEVRVGDRRLFTAIIRDTTEHKRVEQALRENEAALRKAQAIAQVGSFELKRPFDPPSCHWSEELLRILGLDPARDRPSAEQVIEQRIHPDDQGFIRQYLEEEHSQKESEEREIRIVRPDGSIRHARCICEWSRFDGQPAVLVGVLHDITDHKTAEEEQARLRKDAQERGRLADIGALAAKLVHDLGNPLAGLMMQAQLALRCAQRGDSAQKVAEPIEQILSSSRHLEAMVRDFREFAREQKLDLVSVEVEEFVREVTRLWQPIAHQSGVTLHCIVAPDLPPLIADEGKLRRVMDNLVKNALEAIESGPGVVTIRASCPDGEKLVLSVLDTGPGIAANVQLFRLFETTKPSGTGLGLAVCKQIVLAHGGNIRVEALVPHGTAFHLELPVQGLGEI